MPKTAAATQQFVAIKTINDGVVTLKNGQLCAVLLASSINFALKSSDEQAAILSSFQNFLNTLDFSLQFYVQSRRLNIEPYLKLLSERERDQDNDLMRIQLREYIDFIRTFTTEVDIMAKSFYVVIPYTASPINVQKSLTSLFGGGASAQKDQTTLFEEQVIQLEQRVSLVSSGLSGLGIKTLPLGTDDLVELFYHVYNPTDPTGKAPAH